MSRVAFHWPEDRHIARLQHSQQARRQQSGGGGHDRRSARRRVPKCLEKMKKDLLVGVDLLAGFTGAVPLGAELVDAFSSHVAGSLVADVVVERVTCVRDLTATVTASCGADQTGACTHGSLRSAVAQ